MDELLELSLKKAQVCPLDVEVFFTMVRKLRPSVPILEQAMDVAVRLIGVMPLEPFLDLESLHSSSYFRFALVSASLIVFPLVSAKNHVVQETQSVKVMLNNKI